MPIQNMSADKEDNVLDLPTGISSFTNIRNWNLLYVDKTDIIYSMLKKDRRIFLSRPRRFGKTLLVSTLKALFSGQLNYFKNLKIEKLWKETEKYRVVYLDFSEIKEKTIPNEMKTKFNEILRTGFKSAGFTYIPNEMSLISQLSSWLSEQNGDIVLLIDEYDAPLNSNLHNADLFSFAKELTTEFFTTIKVRDDAFRLVFITGIAKFAKAGIFSAMNQIKDISLLPQFGTLLGYTEEEIKQYFGWYLERSARTRHESVQELLDEMREMYDGFCFDKKAQTHVFSPWSVLNFLSDNLDELGNYWFDSVGNSTVIRNLMQTGLFVKPEQIQREFSVSFSELGGSYSIENLKAPVLMFQTGYLTIKAVDSKIATLAYPNREVASSMELLRAEEFTASDNLDFLGLNNFRSCLREQNIDGVLECLNRFFASIAYDRYPVKDESTFRGMLYSLFAGLDFLALAEHHNNHGSTDLEVLTGAPHKKGTVHWVFELKYSPDSKSVDAAMKEAMGQTRIRDYGNPNFSSTVVRVAMVFDGEKRQIVRWEQIQD